MKVFVISLKDSHARQENVNRQLTAAGINYEFFDAANGRDGYEKFFDAYDEREYLLNTGRVSTPGEIGCYASHLALWKRCVELNEPIMIMEDDFKLDALFPEAVAEVEKLIKDYGFIRFQTERRGKKKKLKQAGKFSLYFYTKMPHSLMCYAIRPDVARAFIAGSHILREPVDVFVKKTWEHQQPLFGLAPYTVSESEHSDATTISGRIKASKSPGIRFFRLLRKISWLIKRFTFNQRQSHLFT